MDKVCELRQMIRDLVDRITDADDLRAIYRLVNRLFCRR